MHLRRGSREHGASAVEFALVLPILVVLVFGIVTFGLTFFRWQAVQSAAREAARVYAVTDDFNAAETAGRSVLPSPPFFSSSDVEFVVVDSCDGRGSPVTITARVENNADYVIEIPFVPTRSVDLSSTATFVCERISQ